MTRQLDAGAITQSPEARVQAWLTNLESALAARDIDRVVAKFVPDSLWRDLVTFTWNIKTIEGRKGIADMLRARLADADPSGFRAREAPTDDGGGVTSAFIEFETAVGRGVGHLRLKGDLGWTLLTALDELKGHEEPIGSRRVLGAVHGPDPDGRSWADKRAEQEASLGYSQQPYVVVVGGSQGGIALGARLRQLGVPAIVVDKHARPGDQWRKRYKTKSATGWSSTPG
jgi:putative flavoprotein involved in K+ transport